jgi:hypothetical protein
LPAGKGSWRIASRRQDPRAAVVIDLLQEGQAGQVLWGEEMVPIAFEHAAAESRHP